MMAEQLLELEAICSGYGSIQVLFDIDLTIAPGEIVGLMGRNGMGKSTLLKTILGIVPHQQGTRRVMGKIMGNLPSHAVARAGIGYVPEGRQVFPTLNVRENLVCVEANHRGLSEPWNLDRVLDLFPRLGQRMNQLAGTLSGGEQQMLAIGRALMTNPLVMLLDEATEGLAPLMRQEVWHVLQHNLREAGQAILLVDQNPEAMLRICDRQVILNNGQVVWRGPSKMLHQEPELMEKYLGLGAAHS
jgi:branched-chain amino acid transport system ATP-binding protein